MSRLSFRRAVITGGSSGIGFSIASLLVQQGTEVILIARNPDNLAKAAAKLSELVSASATASSSGSIHTLSMDISDRGSMQKLEKALQNGPAPDLLINCAGTAYPHYFEQLDSDIFDAMVSTNLTGTWNVLKTVVPFMQPGGGGRIVNVSSVAGLVGTFGYTAYSATKFGIIGLSEALRNELSVKGIRVSVLCPPDTNTPQLEEENRTKPAETRAIAGNAGIMEPEQVAKSLFKGLKRNNFIIIPGFQGVMINLIKRLFPGLLFSIIDSTAKKTSGRKHE